MTKVLVNKDELVAKALKMSDLDKAFTILYNVYYPEILFHITSKMGNSVEAEEVTSETFIKLYQKFNLFNKSKGQFNTWLYTVANNAMFDHFRKGKKLKANVNVNGYTDSEGNENYDFVAPTSMQADKKVLDAETRQKLELAFNSLGERYIDIANFYFIYEYKYSEIATMLNIPEGSVKGMINRIRAKLTQSLSCSVKVAKTA